MERIGLWYAGFFNVLMQLQLSKNAEMILVHLVFLENYIFVIFVIFHREFSMMNVHDFLHVERLAWFSLSAQKL